MFYQIYIRFLKIAVQKCDSHIMFSLTESKFETISTASVNEHKRRESEKKANNNEIVGNKCKM